MRRTSGNLNPAVDDRRCSISKISAPFEVNTMRDDFVVADFAEAWLAKFPRIEERGLGPRLLAALAGMSGGPNAVDDLDDVEVIAAALLELVAMLRASPGGLATHFPALFGNALKGKAGLS